MDFKRLLRELARSGPGRVGLVMLAVMVLASAYVVATYPPNYGTARWGNPSLWADHPKSAPPAWTAWFSRQKPARHQILASTEPASVQSSPRAHVSTFSLRFMHDGDEPPTFLALSVAGVVYHSRPPVITATLVRPDGREAVLYRGVIAAPRPGESPPYRRHEDVPLRIAIDGEERALRSAAELVGELWGSAVSERNLRGAVARALFGVPRGVPNAEPLRFETLKGEYELKVEVTAVDAADRVGAVRAVIGGSVYGLMGTDALGRDLAEGLLFGLPVALLIGLAASTVSTAIGTTLGLMSGYLGGRWDNIIQRAADIVANVPVLPLLIFLVFIGGTQLWLILLVLVAFSWPGLTITVRSMALQYRTGPEVEAARALGASGARVIFRHIFPHTAAYIFAQLVFFAPSAILAEAGLSFLGLGDPSIPTWGQILEHGFRTGAVFLGYWWWIVPPGALIVLTAVTFMLLALGLEPAIDPRLRRSRAWRS